MPLRIHSHSCACKHAQTHQNALFCLPELDIVWSLTETRRGHKNSGPAPSLSLTGLAFLCTFLSHVSCRSPTRPLVLFAHIFPLAVLPRAKRPWCSSIGLFFASAFVAEVRLRLVLCRGVRVCVFVVSSVLYVARQSELKP